MNTLVTRWVLRTTLIDGDHSTALAKPLHDFLVSSMAAALLITLRETLEASLIVGIVLAVLDRTNARRWNTYVWGGVACGIALSIALSWLLSSLMTGLTGRAEHIYEASLMFVVAGLIVWMVLWMYRQSGNIRATLEMTVDTHARAENPLGIFFLVCLSVLREGVETVLFLQAAFMQSQSLLHNFGAALGMVIALSLAWLLFRGLHLVSLRWLFVISGIALLFFAVSLMIHGIGELGEAGLLMLGFGSVL